MRDFVAEVSIEISKRGGQGKEGLWLVEQGRPCTLFFCVVKQMILVGPRSSALHSSRPYCSLGDGVYLPSNLFLSNPISSPSSFPYPRFSLFTLPFLSESGHLDQSSSSSLLSPLYRYEPSWA